MSYHFAVNAIVTLRYGLSDSPPTAAKASPAAKTRTAKATGSKTKTVKY